MCEKRLQKLQDIFKTALPELTTEQIRRISIISKHIIARERMQERVETEERTLKDIKKMMEDSR